VSTLVTAGLGLSLVIGPPLLWAFLGLLVVTVWIGTNQILRSHPRLNVADAGVAIYVLPTLIVCGAALFLRLPNVGRGLPLAIGLLAAGSFLATALYAEYLTYDPSARRSRGARLVLSLIAYVIGFVLFAAIFAPKFRSILSATAILVTSALISAELFRGSGRIDQHAMWIAVVAVCLGQVTWALNYWVLGAFAGGAILLLVFYTLTGLIRSHLNGTLAPRVISEHLAVAAAGLTAVVVGGLWLR
jgi:hypothetical protein